MFWWLLLAGLGTVLIVGWELRSRTKPRPKPSAKPRTKAGTRKPSTRPPARPTAGRATPTAAKTKARPKTQTQTPAPGEIWWADVPYEDSSGHKIRPCVVLRGSGQYRDVLKITSQDQSHRGDHIRIPTKTWDSSADHDSYLDLTGPVQVAVAEFDDRAGVLDPAIWRQVKQLYKL